MFLRNTFEIDTRSNANIEQMDTLKDIKIATTKNCGAPELAFTGNPPAFKFIGNTLDILY